MPSRHAKPWVYFAEPDEFRSWVRGTAKTCITASEDIGMAAGKHPTHLEHVHLLDLLDLDCTTSLAADSSSKSATVGRAGCATKLSTYDRSSENAEETTIANLCKNRPSSWGWCLKG